MEVGAGTPVGAKLGRDRDAPEGDSREGRFAKISREAMGKRRVHQEEDGGHGLHADSTRSCAWAERRCRVGLGFCPIGRRGIHSREISIFYFCSYK
jgi:hypothetical protein